MIFVNTTFEAMMIQMNFLDHGLVPPSYTQLSSHYHFYDDAHFIQFTKTIDESLNDMSDDEKRVCKRKFRKILKKAINWHLKNIEKDMHNHYSLSKPLSNKIIARRRRVMNRRINAFLNSIGYTTRNISHDLQLYSDNEKASILYRRKLLVIRYFNEQTKNSGKIHEDY